MQAVDRLLRYVKGTANLAIQYGGAVLVVDPNKGTLHRYTDSDLVNDIETYKSTGGFVSSILEGLFQLNRSDSQLLYYRLLKQSITLYINQLLKQFGYVVPLCSFFRLTQYNLPQGVT